MGRDTALRMVHGRRLVRLVSAALAIGALLLLAPFASALAPGTITTIAGSSVPGPVSATSLGLEPWGLVADPATGGFYVADIMNSVVRKVLPNGTVVLVAGDGGRGYSGDGAAATSAELNQPTGLALDAQGDLLIADSGSNVVRMVAGASGTAFGQPVTAGSIYTVAGNGTNGFGGDGGPATAAQLGVPKGVAADGSGNLIIADTNNNRIRVVAATSGVFYGQAM